MAKEKKSMDYDERKVYTEAFRKSDGKRLTGRSGDAAAAVKAYRAKKTVDKADGNNEYINRRNQENP